MVVRRELVTDDFRSRVGEAINDAGFVGRAPGQTGLQIQSVGCAGAQAVQVKEKKGGFSAIDNSSSQSDPTFQLADYTAHSRMTLQGAVVPAGPWDLGSKSARCYVLPRIGPKQVVNPNKICSTILRSGQLSGGSFGHLEGYGEGYKLNNHCIFTLVSLLSRRSNQDNVTIFSVPVAGTFVENTTCSIFVMMMKVQFIHVSTQLLSTP